MEEQRINNAAIGGAIGFFSVFCDFHEKYLKKGVKISFNNNTLTELFTNYIPYVVNGAFACELAMKSVICEKNAKKIRHNLKEIYTSNFFDQQYKDAILSTFLSHGLSKTDFNIVLEESSNIFNDWRYFYENSKNALSVPKYFYEFVCSCVKTMIDFSNVFNLQKGNDNEIQF